MSRISVIVCTYNRADSIKDLLNCLLTQELKETFEVIVVDNNSRDDTKLVVESFGSKFEGKLRYFFEPRQGKTFALNLGIKEARGEIIAFTDDDCLVDKNYLFNIYEAFHKNGAEIGVVGGRIVPLWANDVKLEWAIDLKSEDWWSSTFFKGPVGIFDYGDKPFIIDLAQGIHKHVTFYGANSSIRKEVLDQFGYFNTEKTVGEDTEMCRRLFKAGVKGLYMPQIIVHHKVNAAKITPQFFYRWYYLRGCLLEVQEYQKKFYHPFGIQWELIAETVNLWIGSIFTHSLSYKVYYRSHALFNLGQMVQIIKK